jgi:hypothetical protein
MEQEILSIIDKGRELKVQIGKLVTKHDYPKGNKNLVLLGYYSIMVEHHSAIHLLIQNELNGSAFALVRALYEPLYRAHWVNACATDDQIDKIIKGKDIFPKMNEMVEQIDNAYRTGDFWQMIKTNSWSAMNDYTHSGMRQLSRRFIENEVAPNYDLGELIEVLNGTNMALLLMALFSFNVYNKTEEVKVVRQMIMEYSDKVKNA